MLTVFFQCLYGNFSYKKEYLPTKKILFFIFLNVGKVQSGKHVNKKHFQNNSNKIDP